MLLRIMYVFNIYPVIYLTLYIIYRKYMMLNDAMIIEENKYSIISTFIGLLHLLF